MASRPIGDSTGIDNQPYRLQTGFTDPSSHRFIAVNDPRMVPKGLTYESRAVPANTAIPVTDSNGNVTGHMVNGHFVRAGTLDQRTDAQVMRDLAHAGGDPRDFFNASGRFDRVGALSRLGQLNQDDGTPAGRPMTEYQQKNLELRQEQEARLKQKGASAGKTSSAAPLDSPRRLNADLQAMHGHDLTEFQNAGPEDTRPENGGMAFYMGGEDGDTKERVFMTGPQYAQYQQRLQSLQNGQAVQNNPSAGRTPQAPSGSAAKPLDSATLASARNAIATKGREAVIQRLQQAGYDTTGL